MPPPNTVPPGNAKKFPLVVLLFGVITGGVFVGVVAAFFLGIQIFLVFSGDQGVREGVYLLNGSSSSDPSLSSSYTGTVMIFKIGSAYGLSWYIGNQTQRGIGILTNDILSVSYMDTTEGSMNDFGAVSYRVVPNGLEGQWVSALGNGSLGKEHLTWQEPFSDDYSDPEIQSGDQEEMDRINNAIDYEANRSEGDTSINPYGTVTVEESGNVTNVYVD